MKPSYLKPLEKWTRPPGRLCTTWMKNILWRSVFAGSWDLRGYRFGTKSASLETDVFAQRCTLVVVHATIGLEVLPPVRYCLYAKYKQNGQFLYNQFDKSDSAVKNDDIQSLDDTVMHTHTHTRAHTHTPV